jgi:probable F420-dependent oxidoreductase
MKIGLFAISAARENVMQTVTAYASNADRLGFHTLWVPEHVVLLDKYASKYPYSESGQLPARTDAAIPDPFIALTAMGAVTSKIRLATGICLVPEHNPVDLAKVVASLDWMSGGRVALGVGIGWLEEEFQALNIPWERRSARTLEYIDAMRKLWGDPVSSFAGEFVKFDSVRSYPKPAQGAKLPIIFGGESGPALRRVASHGIGWFGFNLLPHEAEDKLNKLDDALAARGRKRSEIEIIVSPSGKRIVPDDLKRYRDAGVDEVVIVTITPPRTAAEAPKILEEAARTWLEPASKI